MCSIPFIFAYREILGMKRYPQLCLTPQYIFGRTARRLRSFLIKMYLNRILSDENVPVTIENASKHALEYIKRAYSTCSHICWCTLTNIRSCGSGITPKHYGLLWETLLCVTIQVLAYMAFSTISRLGKSHKAFDIKN